MATDVQIRLVILWERELRLTARMLKQASDMLDAEREVDPKAKVSAEASRALFDAFDAACAALLGADDDSAALMLSSRPIGDLEAAPESEA